jgi:hypothetical protein
VPIHLEHFINERETTTDRILLRFVTFLLHVNPASI